MADEEEYNNTENNIFTVIYETIKANFHEFGYTKSPDYKIKREHIKNKKFLQWLEKRKLDPSKLKYDESEFQNNFGDDDYNIKSGIEEFMTSFAIPAGDRVSYEYVSWERITEMILLFCDKLFGNWMEEYERLNAQPV